MRSFLSGFILHTLNRTLIRFTSCFSPLSSEVGRRWLGRFTLLVFVLTNLQKNQSFISSTINLE